MAAAIKFKPWQYPMDGKAIDNPFRMSFSFPRRLLY
jgi:hypothetical protein